MWLCIIWSLSRALTSLQEWAFFFLMINRVKERVFQLFLQRLECTFGMACSLDLHGKTWEGFVFSSPSEFSLCAPRGTCLIATPLSSRFKGGVHARACACKHNTTKIPNAVCVHFGVSELFARLKDLGHKNEFVYLCKYKHSATVSAHSLDTASILHYSLSGRNK